MTDSPRGGSSGNGFTLIELLVVVAVVAILAAIAVVNFQNASVRSKVSRAKADMASIQTALEAYAVDEGTYPLNAGGIGLPGALYNLTEPTSYISAVPLDVFRERQIYFYLAGGTATNVQQDKFGYYSLASAGPDGRINTSLTSALIYDPTNGTVSAGDVLFSHRTREPRATGAPVRHSASAMKSALIPRH